MYVAYYILALDYEGYMLPEILDAGLHEATVEIACYRDMRERGLDVVKIERVGEERSVAVQRGSYRHEYHIVKTKD
jgi:hypothetical protein